MSYVTANTQKRVYALTFAPYYFEQKSLVALEYLYKTDVQQINTRILLFWQTCTDTDTQTHELKQFQIVQTQQKIATIHH